MPTTDIMLDFADGEYLFALKLPQLAELQEKCRAGIFAIYGRVLRGRYVVGDAVVGQAWEGEAHSEDLYQVIRLGLIGGGEGLVDGAKVAVSALIAKSLMDRYVYPMPLTEAWTLAAAILTAKIEGYTPPKAKPAVAPAASKARRRKGST